MPSSRASSPAFAALGLGHDLQHAVTSLGFHQPTPVQVEAIPAILRGGDLWASAKTGSGKTAAFLLPLLERLRRQERRAGGKIATTALVLAPTRELAVQVSAAADELARHVSRPPRICVAVGGVSINPQLLALRGGADLVVATPGRLLDLVDHNALSLGDVEALVLDEADRLLSLGFADELDRICALVPAGCQRLLFSATFPAGVRALVAQLLHEPRAINIDAGGVPDARAIVQRAIAVDEGKRGALLRQLLQTERWPSVLIFVATQHAAEQVAQKLVRVGVRAAALHGGLAQGTRTSALADFKDGRLQVLVATDLAARGLDIGELAAVINFDLPRSPVDYLHRIGRTGRAGASGIAVSFITAAATAHFDLIVRRHHLAITREILPGFEPTEAPVPPQKQLGGIKGKRPSKKDKLRAARAARGERGE